MDDGSMAEALVSQNLLARRQALLFSIDGEEREHGRQLLPTVRSLDGIQGYGGYQQADGGGSRGSTPLARAICSADCPTNSRLRCLDFGSKARSVKRETSSGVSTAAPQVCSAARKGSRTVASTTSWCSEPQITP